MITNFKMFENNTSDKQFWVVENDKNLKIRLFKLGMSDKIILNFLSQLKQKYLTDRYYYIGFDENDGWTYCRYNYTSGGSIYKDDNYEFMGHVDINDNDIYIYNNREEINKYNL